MATLQEIATSKRTTAVGGTGTAPISAGGAANIQASQVRDNTAKLVSDLAVGAGRIIQEKYEASEYAGKRAGMDNLVAYKKEMAELDAEYSSQEALAYTSQDWLNKSKREEDIYKKHLARGAFGDNDIANQAFKDTYGIPATEDLFKSKTQNTAIASKLYKDEEITSVKDEINVLSGAYKKDQVKIWQERLAKVGVPRESVWGEVVNELNSRFSDKYKDGLSSQAIIAKMQNGVLTQGILDEVFNDVFGNFAQRTNGEFSKVVSDIDEKAYESMKKSFNGWLDRTNKKGPEGIIDATAIQLVDGLKINNSLVDMQNAENELTKQMVEVQALELQGNKKAASKLVQLRNSQIKLASLAAKKEALNKAFDIFKNSSDTSSLEVDIIHKHTIQSYSGFDTVEKTEVIKANEVATYISDKLNTQLINVLSAEKKDEDKASGIAKDLARLHASNMEGVSQSLATSKVKTVSNLSSIGTAKTVGQLVNGVQFAVTYNKEAALAGYNSVSDKLLKATLSYAGELKDRQDLNEGQKLKKLKTLVNAYVKNDSMALFEGVERTLKRFKIDDIDSILTGYVAGKARMVDGSLQILVSDAISGDTVYYDEDKFKKRLQANAIELDESYLPFLGKSTAIASPVENPSETKKIQLRDNFIDMVKYKLKDNAKIQRINLKDISREDELQVRQIQTKDGIQTIVELFDSGEIVSRAIIDDDEWKTGVTSEEKAKVDKEQIEQGLPALFGSSKPKTKRVARGRR